MIQIFLLVLHFFYELLLVSVTFCDETFVILSEILSPLKSAIASAVFWIPLFKAVLDAIIADFLKISGNV